MAKYSRYIPWVLSLLGGLLALYLGTQPPDVVKVPVPQYDTVTVEKLVVREGQARLVYVYKSETTPPRDASKTSNAGAADSAALARSMALSDSLFYASQNEPELAVWMIDTTYTVDVVSDQDTARVPIHIHMEMDRSTGMYSLTIEAGAIVFERTGCADQSGIWWQLATSVSAAATGVLLLLKK